MAFVTLATLIMDKEIVIMTYPMMSVTCPTVLVDKSLLLMD